MYEKCCELMYDMISKRIKTKRSLLQKRNCDIYEDDVNLISAIANNRRDHKKNKYLIPAETSRSEEPKKYISTISTALEFTSFELLWGNLQEIEAYAGKLFETLIEESLEFEDETTVQQVNNILTDYIPFALSEFYTKLLIDYSEVADFFIDSKYHLDIFEERNNATLRLYNRIKFEFIDLITDFFCNRKDTQKLDKAFSCFFKTKFLPLMQNTLSENSIGNIAKEIMLQNHEQLIKLELYQLSTSPEARYYDYEYDYYDGSVIIDLIMAGSQYIDNLVRIQRESEEPLNIDVLQNTWSPEMCI